MAEGTGISEVAFNCYAGVKHTGACDEVFQCVVARLMPSMLWLSVSRLVVPVQEAA